MSESGSIVVNSGNVVWSIQNFSLCPLKCGQFLKSPCFGISPALWYLRLYPRGTINNDYEISCLLMMHRGFDHENINYSIEILSVDGGRLVQKLNNCVLFRGADVVQLVNRNDIFRQRNLFLPNDTLKIFLKLRNFSFPRIVFNSDIFTVIDVEKYFFTWSLMENLSNTKEITLSEKIKFVMTGFIKDGVLKINTEVVNVKPSTRVFKWKLSLLQNPQSEKLLKESETFFDGIRDAVLNSYEITLSPPGKKNLTGQPILLDEPQLVRFRIELAFSQVECEEEDVEACNDSCTTPPLKLNVLPNQTSDSHDLFRDFLLMYTTEKMTDVTLRVDGQIFQAHKFVLSARSPVFSAMFEKDMLENQSGVVDIKDLDAETLNYFLLYLYGGALQKLNKESARKLILVADRYLVPSLKEDCSSFLVSSITEETVCETLVLADMINDEKLKEIAISFFMSHAATILESLEWKQCQENHPKLANEALMKFALEACSKSST